MRYIVLDSTFRDRNRFPQPAQFHVPLSFSSDRGNAATAMDPVSLAEPIEEWTSFKFDAKRYGDGIYNLRLASSSNVPNTNSSGLIGNATATTTLFLADASGTRAIDRFQKEAGYYNGATLHLEITGDGKYHDEARILEYEYMGDFDPSISGTPTISGDVVRVVVDKVFDLYAKHENTLTFHIVDPSSKATLNGSDKIYLFTPKSTSRDNSFPNFYLYNETKEDYAEIEKYYPTTHIVRADISGKSWDLSDNYNIRRDLPQVFDVSGGPSSTTINIKSIPSGVQPSSENEYYVNNFLRVQTKDEYGTGKSSTVGGETRKITAYDGSTKTITVSPPFSGVVDSSYNVEVEFFSYDQYNPLTYMGSIVSQQQQVCYEIELLSLILPNVELNAALGGRSVYYPYFWVKFGNRSNDTKNIIISNNPHAGNALFKAAIDDISEPDRTKFIKIDGDGSRQTIKFRPNEDLTFAVYLPNGELFQTTQPEFFSPSLPNPYIQISAMFGLKRIS